MQPVYKKEQSEGGPAVKNSWLTSSYIDLPETSLECQRWSSESALDAIDRDATFQQSELQPNQVTVTQVSSFETYLRVLCISDFESIASN